MKIKFTQIVPDEIINMINTTNFQVYLITEQQPQRIKVEKIEHDSKMKFQFSLQLSFENP